jgi:DNA-binding IclR family transcriptional regulator
MRQSQSPPASSGIGVLDRCVLVLEAVEAGARTLNDVTGATGLTRPTAHRLLLGLERHDLLTRVGGLGYRLGPRLLRMSAVAMRELPMRDLAHPALERLARTTGESAQLYVRAGDRRVCIDTVESTNELRTIVDIGASLPLTAGSAGKIFLAWDQGADLERVLAGYRPLTPGAPDAAGFRRSLVSILRKGWASSIGEREPGVASVSAPVLGTGTLPVAVVSISGPSSRLGASRAATFAPAVQEAAREIRQALGYHSA